MALIDIKHITLDYSGERQDVAHIKAVFMALHRGKPVAHGVVYWYNDGFFQAVLGDLHVIPKYRNQGIGNTMQKAREEYAWAHLNGLREFHLSVKKDSWMIEWYRRRGYELTGKISGPVENNELWMKKPAH